MSPEAFFEACAAAFESAAQRAGQSDLWLTMAGRRVRLRFAGTTLRAIMEPAFSHLAAAPGHADFSLAIWDFAESGVAMPPRPWPPDCEGPLGWVAGWGERRFAICIQDSHVAAFDSERHCAFQWVRGAAKLQPWERFHPLRASLFAWARARNLHFVHAGAVGFGGLGAIVVGPGGSGKSTTVLACMRAGGRAAGDDYILLEGSREFRAHSIYGNMRIFRHHAERFPGLLPPADDVSPGHDGAPKLTSHVSLHDPARLVETLRVAAVIVPRIVPGARTRAVRESGSAALVALAPSSLKQLDPRNPAAFAAMAQVCRTLPCWRLELGSDIAVIAGAVREVVAQSAEAAIP